MTKTCQRIVCVLALAALLGLSLLSLVSCSAAHGELVGNTYAGGGVTMTFDKKTVTIRNQWYTGTATYSFKTKTVNKEKRTYLYLTFAEGEYDFDLDDHYRFESGEDGFTLGGQKFVLQK